MAVPPNRAGPAPQHANLFVPNLMHDEELSHLLPYLALGFAPVQTSGVGFLCGVFALCISYQSAWEFFNPGQEFHGPNEQDWRDIRQSDVYGHKVDAHMAKQELYMYMSDDEFQKARDGFITGNNLDINIIILMLQAANTIYNTNFELGFIIEGVRCKWIASEKVSNWDINFFRPRIAVLQSPEDLNINRIRANPTIWVYNNNVERRNADWSRPEVMNHWQGMSYKWAANYQWPEDDPGAKVRKWGLGREIDEYLAKGIHYLNDDHHPQAGSTSELEVSQGHFVREITLPPGLTGRANYTYVSACNKAYHGFVPTKLLTQVSLTANAPKPSDDPIVEETGQKPETWFGKDRPPRALDVLLDLEAPPDPRPAVPPVRPLIIGERNLLNRKATEQATVDEYVMKALAPSQDKSFIIRRAKAVLNEDGVFKPANADGTPKYGAAGFDFKEGDLLRDTETRLSLWPIVDDITGIRGHAEDGNIEEVDSPWLFPPTMKMFGAVPYNCEPFRGSSPSKFVWNSAVDKAGFLRYILQYEDEINGIQRITMKDLGGEQAVIGKILEWEAARYRHLPMVRYLKQGGSLKKSGRPYTPNEGLPARDIEEGEILRIIARSENFYDVVDYLGNPLRIPKTHGTEFIGWDFEKKKYPFGVLLDKTQDNESIFGIKVAGKKPQDSLAALNALRAPEIARYKAAVQQAEDDAKQAEDDARQAAYDAEQAEYDAEQVEDTADEQEGEQRQQTNKRAGSPLEGPDPKKAKATTSPSGGPSTPGGPVDARKIAKARKPRS